MNSSCVRREQRGEPAAPLDLSAGEEVAGDGPYTVSCPCRTLEGGPSFDGIGCWQGVRLASDSCLSSAR